MSRCLAALIVIPLLLAASTAAADKFVNKKTGDVGKGKVLTRQTQDGRERILVEAESGKISWIWADEWEVVPDDQPMGKADVPEGSTPKSAVPAGGAGVIEVEVTGVGLGAIPYRGRVHRRRLVASRGSRAAERVPHKHLRSCRNVYTRGH